MAKQQLNERNQHNIYKLFLDFTGTKLLLFLSVYNSSRLSELSRAKIEGNLDYMDYINYRDIDHIFT